MCGITSGTEHAIRQCVRMNNMDISRTIRSTKFSCASVNTNVDLQIDTLWNQNLVSEINSMLVDS